MTTHNMLARMSHDNISLAGFRGTSMSPCGDISLPAMLLRQWSIASNKYSCQLQLARYLVPQRGESAAALRYGCAIRPSQKAPPVEPS